MAHRSSILLHLSDLQFYYKIFQLSRKFTAYFYFFLVLFYFIFNTVLINSIYKIIMNNFYNSNKNFILEQSEMK